MYNIFKIEGNKKVASGVDLDSFVKFCQGHNMKLYRAEEIREGSGGSVVSLIKNTKEDLDLYKKSLSLAQINDISTGVKSIEYSKELGFYLKVLKSGEELEHHISLPREKDVVIKKSFEKGDIIYNAEYTRLPYYCHEYFSLIEEENGSGFYCNRSISFELRIKF